MKSCLICDDHAMLRESLAGLVEGSWPQADISIASDYLSAWAAIEAGPDLCITDLSMPGADPSSGISVMRQAAPDTPILVVTGNEDDALLLELFNAGISGFVAKTSQSAIVEAAIRVVLAGESYIPQRILALTAGSSGTSSSASTPRLTVRQGDVLRLIADGKSNKEVARQLDLSPATVKAHAAAAFAVLGATNRMEGVLKAKELGLI
jgi:DNA-binding NarL/FixJ family response regulator